MDYDQIIGTNRKVYDAMAAADDPLCRPAKDDELANPLATVDAAGWLGDSIAGRHLLCLAAGGGRQSSLYAAAGAIVTVVDLSGAMLELDRQVALQRGDSIRLFETSMDDLSMLRDGEFDIVIHPVSTCYLPSVQRVFAEVARVTRPGGIYVSQHKQPVSLQASVDPVSVGGGSRRSVTNYSIVTIANRQSRRRDASSDVGRRLRESGAVEFLHRWEQLIGGMCRAGFRDRGSQRTACTLGKMLRQVRSLIAPATSHLMCESKPGEEAIRCQTRVSGQSLWLPNG